MFNYLNNNISYVVSGHVSIGTYIFYYLKRNISFILSPKWNSVIINNLSLFDDEAEFILILSPFHSFLKNSEF